LLELYYKGVPLAAAWLSKLQLGVPLWPPPPRQPPQPAPAPAPATAPAPAPTPASTFASLSVTAAPIGPPVLTQEMVMGLPAGASRRQHALRPAPFPPPATSAPALAIMSSASPTAFARDPRTAAPVGSASGCWVGGSSTGAMQLSPESEPPEPPAPQLSSMPCVMPCTALVTRPPEASSKTIESLSDEWCVFAREFGFSYHEVAPTPLAPAPSPRAPRPLPRAPRPRPLRSPSPSRPLPPPSSPQPPYIRPRPPNPDRNP
jgi:hypothetical protein